MRLVLHVWRQKNPATRGRMVRYDANSVNPDMSMLELLDVVNEDLILKGEEPIAFEHDCRVDICGSCGFMINGIAHGPLPASAVCQLSMRHFKDGQQLYIEPGRAKAFPVIKDLIVDRSAFDRIIQAEATSLFPPAAPPMATRFWFPRMTPAAPWTPPHASAAAPA